MIADTLSDLPVLKLPLKDVVFDPENPRTQTYIDNKLAKGQKLHSISQEQLEYAQNIKTNKSRKMLYEQIESRGQIDPIWVYEKNGKYVVIEGNTRLLVFRELASAYPSEEKWQCIKAKIIPENDYTQDAVSFIKLESHLGGKEKWDPYERAKELYKQHNNGHSIHELSKASRTKESEIIKDIEAYKLMKEEFLPNYGKTVASIAQKFSYFVEFLKNDKIKNLLRKGKFTKDEFYGWVAVSKIPRAIDVRELPVIFDIDEAAHAFKKGTWDDAMAKIAIYKPQKSEKIYTDIDLLIKKIDQMKNYEIEDLNNTPAKKNLLKELIDKASNLVRE